ncbi:Acyl-CoA N-acyltransferase [Penicillium expansum]|uniref:Acyl-CoA N-acyltransferase n=1 Tax=Penicillium expansum TaxID=27334 RepID=A0A0A2IPK2_PENEN|nr:Acyl-CoA N-acyltransferase [Penicillium expansum]KGO44378.1 Acyl-CoA N-acyltransferase [Penicillium expansum]KGO50076.1 Acyl-CoA N-acyltransferase [Penicillium expansum]KGO58633.1 Acyl-CoA N-acyltransferase [Penicillium expansum]
MAVASVPITYGGDRMLSSVAALNGRVFDTDPVIAYMLLSMSQEERLAYLPTYWTALIKSALLNHAVITEADDWKAASVMIPPGGYIENAWTLLWAGFLGVLWRIGFAGIKVGESPTFSLRTLLTSLIIQRLWFEFSGMTDNAKRNGLRGHKQYYYIFSLGTEHEHRGKGIAKAIMRDHQQTAQAANLPIWLEATTEGSRALYLSMGFEEIEEIRLGKGKVAADASLQSGGPGVSLWAMVWWPNRTPDAIP